MPRPVTTRLIRIDSSIVQVHQHASGVKMSNKTGDRCVGEAAEGSTKIHARIDHQGRPIKILITLGQVYNLTSAPNLSRPASASSLIRPKMPSPARAHINARELLPIFPTQSGSRNASGGPSSLSRQQRR